MGNPVVTVSATAILESNESGNYATGNVDKVHLQSGVKANLASSAGRCQGTARRIERALGNSMVLLVELEGDGIANSCSNVRRAVCQNIRTADNDLVVNTASGCRRRSCRRVGRKCRGSDGWSCSRGGGGGRGGRDGSGGGSCGGGSVTEWVARSSSLECSKLVAWVHREDHALLTVIRLAAVYPDRGEGRNVEIGNRKILCDTIRDREAGISIC